MLDGHVQELERRIKKVEVRTKMFKLLFPLVGQIKQLKQQSRDIIDAETDSVAPREIDAEERSETGSEAEAPTGGDIEEDRYKPRPYRCVGCGRNYSSPGTLKIHMASACRGKRGSGLVQGNGLVQGSGLVQGNGSAQGAMRFGLPVGSNVGVPTIANYINRPVV